MFRKQMKKEVFRWNSSHKLFVFFFSFFDIDNFNIKMLISRPYAQNLEESIPVTSLYK